MLKYWIKLTSQRACYADVPWKVQKHYTKLKGKPPDIPFAVVKQPSP